MIKIRRIDSEIRDFQYFILFFVQKNGKRSQKFQISNCLTKSLGLEPENSTNLLTFHGKNMNLQEQKRKK